MKKKEIIIEKSYWHTDIFEVVDEFPEGYIVWNIGRHNFQHPCLIPLAIPTTEDQCHISRNGLKALRLESEEVALHVLNVASRGIYGKIDRNNIGKVIADYKRNKSQI